MLVVAKPRLLSLSLSLSRLRLEFGFVRGLGLDFAEQARENRKS